MSTNKTIKVALIGMVVALSLLLAANVSAQGLTDSQDIPTYVKNIYQVGLMLVGVAAFLMVIYGGYLYMVSGVNSSLITEAKKVITNALLGLLLLVCAVLILRTINSDLINLTLSDWNLPTVDELQNQAEVSEQNEATIFVQSLCECKCEADSLDQTTYQYVGSDCKLFISSTYLAGQAFHLAHCEDLCSEQSWYQSISHKAVRDKNNDNCYCPKINTQYAGRNECMNNCEANPPQ